MGTPIIKHSLVKLTEPSASGRTSADGVARGARAHGRKDARLVEVDGVARAVEITCACGETTVVELVFDAPQPALPSKQAPPLDRTAGGSPA